MNELGIVGARTGKVVTGAWLLLIVIFSLPVVAQTVTVSPIFPRPDQPVTLTVDVTGTSYANKTGDTYLWTWIPGATVINAPTNVNPATGAQAAAKWTRSVSNGNVYTITFTPTTFFGQPLSAFSGNQIGFLLKATDWSGGQTGDLLLNFFVGFAVRFIQPAGSSLFVDNSQVLNISAAASEASSLVLKVGGVPVNTATSSTTMTYNHTVTETSGTVLVEFQATSDASSAVATTSFVYVVRSATVQAPRPAGIIDGINYDADPTKVTLGLWAPGKSSVYVLGDFNNWDISSAYQMNQDGEHFWLPITGLTPGTEYAYQYLVDETLKLGDPYCDKILDYYNDASIPATTYPNIKPYPAKAVSDKWYFNIVSVFQTGQSDYPWVVTNFTKPPRENLVIYELLVRDYFDANNRNYQNLIDTLTYLKRLGVNAIELMPITEFSGNDSWGYNPIFMFAPDKYYGTKNKLKEFVDVCHQNGIAVIMDLVMNQQNSPNPYVMMDFDFANNRPAPTNKWFNPEATHPFSVFYDMNHESAYTKKYLDTVNYYWLHEFKIDGYRFDLSKGFTQTNSGGDVNLWSQKDDSRIAILERMANVLWSHTPDAYIILEHFADNAEEKILAEYGMMLWGNLNYNYNQNTIGLPGNSDFSLIYYGNRGWSVSHVVGYMESHDEERLMVRNLSQGVSLGAYNVKSVPTAIERMKSINAFFYTIPGPKLLWEFGELGYDISIDLGGRTSAKPVKWEYLADPVRKKLNQVTETLIKLKKTYPIFSTTDVTFGGMTTLQKQIMLKAVPFTSTPSTTDQMSAVIVGNFDVSAKDITVNFPHTGTWYHFYSGGEPINVSNTATLMNLQPGEARIYTNVALPEPLPEIIQFVKPIAPTLTSVLEANSIINIQWQDNSSIETGYAIYRSKNGGAFIKVGEVFANLQFYMDFTGLEPLTTYDFYVEALGSFGNSTSNTMSITTSDQITGLEDEWRGVRVYPNPTSDLVTIELPPSLAGAGWSVNNVLGQPVDFRRVDDHTIDLGHSPPGLYIVVVATSDQSRSFKVLRK